MNKSDSIAALATALSKAQAEIKDATKDVAGRGYKYADLGQILNIIRPIFSKHNLAVTQFPCDSESNDSLSVETILMHESGEWIGNKFSMPVEQIMSNAGKPVTSKAQAAGSVITYARRYALAAVAGITQEDNDASIQREEKQREQEYTDKAGDIAKDFCGKMLCCETKEELQAVFAAAYEWARDTGDGVNGARIQAEYKNLKTLGGWA